MLLGYVMDEVLKQGCLSTSGPPLDMPLIRFTAVGIELLMVVELV
jgi:hypothetical protein